MQHRKLWMIGLLILVGAMLLVGLQRFQEAGQEEPEVLLDPVEAADQQLGTLYSIGQAVTADPFPMTLKWQGEWASLLSPEEAAGVLTSRLGLPGPETSMVQGRTVYGAEGLSEGFSTNLQLTQLEEGKLYAMVRLEAVGDATASSLELLREAQRTAGESLADEGVHITWNAAIQGIAWPATVTKDSPPDLEQASALSHTLEKLESKISGLPKLKLKRAEGFADEQTASQTYAVDALPITVQSGDQRVALQLAVHRNSGTGMDEITIGMPLLTVEY
ncbi:YwmB family TATA-box binding protein [Paenibacillus rubinfantis]|uniref:YwmB family TATA-box binding protein n=1 Tax=Paenibacillus rubinfantis TaxID=1720296 RepID=UPI00073F564A|nr:YwmB family TATA-box binding protein [Paenibacillus rubinfantis]